MKTTKKTKMITLTISLAIIGSIIIGLFTKVTIEVTQEIKINKSSEEVWEVMGNQFTQVHLWSTNFKESKAGGNPKLAQLDYLHRVTLTERGKTVQEMDAYDAQNHSLSYHITEGLPKIAKLAKAVWSLDSISKEQTTANFLFIMETNGLIGTLLKPVFTKKITQSAAEIAEDLKHYVEHNTPHPRKVASQNK